MMSGLLSALALQASHPTTSVRHSVKWVLTASCQEKVPYRPNRGIFS